MATHSSVLAWRIPGTGEPGGLPSMGSHRVGHDWSNLAAVAAGCASPFAVKQILCTELATCKFIMYSFCCFFIIGFSVLQYLFYIYVLFLFGGLYLCPHFSKLPTSHSVFSESHFISQSSSPYLKKKFPLLACNITFLIWVFPFPGALPDQGLNPGLLHCKWILSHLGET